MTTAMSKEQRTRGEDYQPALPVPRAARTRGRPSDFEPDMVAHASELAAAGYDMQEIADELGVSRTTLWKWRKAYPDFVNAIKSSADLADDKVEEALERTAREGNTTAQIFWLKNRRPAKWRDRHETEIIVPVSDNEPETPMRELALQALALLGGAMYDADQPASQPAGGPLIEATANPREERDNGEYRGHREQTNEPRDEPRPTRGGRFDFDPGED